MWTTAEVGQRRICVVCCIIVPRGASRYLQLCSRVAAGVHAQEVASPLLALACAVEGAVHAALIAMCVGTTCTVCSTNKRASATYCCRWRTPAPHSNPHKKGLQAPAQRTGPASGWRQPQSAHQAVRHGRCWCHPAEGRGPGRMRC